MDSKHDDLVHADICIPFDLDGQAFEAVGFLVIGEESTLGEEAIRRTDNGRLVSSDWDWQSVYGPRNELPKELEAYYLATARSYPDFARSAATLSRDNKWVDYWSDLDRQWGPYVLVLRRRLG